MKPVEYDDIDIDCLLVSRELGLRYDAVLNLHNALKAGVDKKVFDNLSDMIELALKLGAKNEARRK